LDIPQAYEVRNVADLDDNARCLKCGYLLRGLSRHECPECGQAFDPADPSTYRVPRPIVATRTQIVVLMLLTLADLSYVRVPMNVPWQGLLPTPGPLLSLPIVGMGMACAIYVARSATPWQRVVGWSCVAILCFVLLGIFV
jgi:hypothetical protein